MLSSEIDISLPEFVRPGEFLACSFIDLNMQIISDSVPNNRKGKVKKKNRV